MITVEKSPAKVALIGNPIIWQLSTDNLYSSLGAYNQTNIRVNGAVAVDQHITLSFGGVLQTFTCKATPDASGLQFRPKGISETLAAYTAYFYDFLKSNYYFQKYYIALHYYTGTYYLIIAVAKDKGDIYNIACINNDTDFVVSTQTSGTDATINDYFQLFFQVEVEKSAGVYEQFSEDFYNVNSALKAYVDIQEKFKQTFQDNTEIFDYEFKFMPLVVDIAIKRQLLRKYIVKYAEFYGTEPTIKPITTSESMYVTNGTLPLWKDIELLNDNSSFWDKLYYSKAFLNYCPDYKLTDSETQEFLYYLVFNAETNATYNILCNATFSDDDFGDVTLRSLTVNQYEALELNVGLSIINTFYPGKTIVDYQIWIENASGVVVSAFKNYVVDQKEYEHKRIFFFRNSLGVMETVRFTGLAETSNKYERSTYELQFPVEFYTKFRSRKQFDVSNTEIIKANSGFVNKATCNYLQEMLLSNEVYELQDATLMPVVIASTELFRHKDDSKLYYILIEYNTTNIGSAYAPKLEIGDFNSDFNNDFGI